MSIKTIEELTRKGLNAPRKTLALCGAADEHSLQAVFKAQNTGIVDPLFFGDAEKIRQIAAVLGETIDDSAIFDVKDPAQSAVEAVAAVRAGKAQVLMKGMMETAEIMRAVIDKENGLLPDEGAISLCSIFEIAKYHKLLAFTDTGMIREPDVAQKKAIVQNAVRLFRSMGYDCPKVAVVCAVEKVNPKMQETVDAAKLVEMNQNGEIDNCIVEGPISMDIALNAETAKHKGFDSKIAGEPDILVMPNVVTGNLIIKAISSLADVRNGLSVTIGAKVPMVITSRGVTPEGKYQAILAAVACAE